MDLTIKKERVLEAAEKCPDAKRILTTLFPEVFEDSLVVKIAHIGAINSEDGEIIACCRTEGKYRERSVWLRPDLNWALVKDDLGVLVLLPTKKAK